MSHLKRLSEPFPPEVEGTLNKGGVSFQFVPVSEVMARLNDVLGVGNWSFQTKTCTRDLLEPDYIIAHVCLTANIDGNTVQMEAHGGTEINRSRKTGDVVALENDYKTAESDALKKAATRLGVGLYLSRSEEALLHEQGQVDVDPAIEQLWGNFKSFTEKFDQDQKVALGEFWKGFAGDRAKPTLQTANAADLTALIDKCVEIDLGAEVVEA